VGTPLTGPVTDGGTGAPYLVPDLLAPDLRLLLVGSAPMIGERHVSEQERKAFASRARG